MPFSLVNLTGDSFELDDIDGDQVSLTCGTGNSPPSTLVPKPRGIFNNGGARIQGGFVNSKGTFRFQMIGNRMKSMWVTGPYWLLPSRNGDTVTLCIMEKNQCTADDAPRERPPADVAPGSGNTNAVGTTDPEQIRGRIVSSAEKDADAWEKMTEAERIEIRKRSVDISDYETKDNVRRLFQNQDGAAPSWCGMYAATKVNEERRSVKWKVSVGAQGMLRCSDFQKLHRADVAILKEDSAHAEKIKQWRAAVQSERGAIEQDSTLASKTPAEKGTLAVERATEKSKSGGAKPAVEVNHHVIITGFNGNGSVATVQGNSGNIVHNGNSKVTRANYPVSKLLVFYCSVPDATCVADSTDPKKGPAGGCPEKNGSACRKPDPQRK